jgi:hypothetical protein
LMSNRNGRFKGCDWFRYTSVSSLFELKPLTREWADCGWVVSMTDEVPEDVQRWTADGRVPLLLSIVKNETSVAGGVEHENCGGMR